MARLSEKQLASRASQAAVEGLFAGQAGEEAENLIVRGGRGPFSLLAKATDLISNILLPISFLGGAVGFLANRKSLSRVSLPLQKTSDALGVLEKPLGETLGHASRAMGSLPAQAGEAIGKITSATGADAVIGRVSSTVSDYAKRTGVSSRVGNFKNQLMQTSTSQALFAGTMIVGQAAQMASGVFDRTRTLRQMQYDLTGKMPSTLDVWLGSGKLHPLVRQARGEASSLRAKAAGLLNIAGMVGNAYMMVRGGGMLKMMAVGMGTGAVANIITAGDTMIKGYSDLTNEHARGGQGSLNSYIAVVGGYAKDANAQAVQQVAEAAFARKMPPKDLLKMLAQTDFMNKLPANPNAGAAAKQPVTVGGKVFTSKSDQGHAAAALAAKAANDQRSAARAG